MSWLTDNFSITILAEDGKSIFFNTEDTTRVVVRDGVNRPPNYIAKDLGKILKIAIVRNTIIVLTEHNDHHRQLSWDIQAPFEGENLYAFDTEGNLLWRSKDLTQASKTAFCGVYGFSEKEKEAKNNMFLIDLDKTHDYCCCFNQMDQFFLIDLTEKKQVRMICVKN